MGRNLNSSLRGRRRRGNSMQAYDALPPELRAWLSVAVLPWSPASAKGIWLRAGGHKKPRAALERLAAVEEATLTNDRFASACSTVQEPGSG